MTKSMLALGFKRCKSDAGVYYYYDKKTKALVIAIVYIDNVCFMGTKGSLLLNELKQKFMARWEYCDLGETTEFLGMHISRDHKNQKIFIDQCKYLEKVLACFNIATNPTHTPLPSEFSFKPNKKQYDPKFHQKYQQLVGSLMYLMIGSRLDIGFTVVKLAQQMANSSNDHYRVGLHLCRYLLVTHRYRLVYNRLSNKLLVAYSDSDWSQDHKHYKSTTSYFTMLAQEITSWLSCKQKSVVLSSTEAKYMVLSDCSCQLVWTSNLLSEIGFDIPVPHLYGDNLGSLFWSSNPVQEKGPNILTSNITMSEMQ